MGAFLEALLLATHTRVCSTSQRGQKEYTVFVCAVEPAVRAAWTPVLNEEHCRWAWFSTGAVLAAASGVSGAPAPLHPVVAALLAQHPDVFASVAADSGGSSAAGALAAATTG